MPDLSFQVQTAEALPPSSVPTLNFQFEVANGCDGEQIHSILLRCQVQIDAPRRRYTATEATRLFDLFGLPRDWGRTLRSIVWVRTSLSVPAFCGRTVFDLPLGWTFDPNAAATKYFEALESGDIPLRFLFQGSAFYGTAEHALQVVPIPWDKEAVFRLPLDVWREQFAEHESHRGVLSLEPAIESLSASESPTRNEQSAP